MPLEEFKAANIGHLLGSINFILLTEAWANICELEKKKDQTELVDRVRLFYVSVLSHRLI
jgi:hypothetical protein